MNAALFLLLFRGAVFAGETDDNVDECTVWHSPVRGERFHQDKRGDLWTSHDKGDRFTRECD